MALMTFEEVRNKLLHSTPVQFCIYVELLESRMQEKGFDSLRECLTAPVSKGGCALEPAKIKDMLYFNPMYRHKADALVIKLQLDMVEPLKPVGAPVGNVNNSPKVKPDNIRIDSKKAYGTSSDYLLGKLKRDRPDIVSRLETGEFTSVRQAALEAGIVKPKYQIEPTIKGVIEFIDRHGLDMQEFIRLYTSKGQLVK
jgi:hypothetical protein